MRLDRVGEEFRVQKRVKQGGPLSPNPFNAVSEEILRNVNWEGKGVMISGQWLNNSWFVENIMSSIFFILFFFI